jgi:ABC-type branched-subunit amino acid transport system ATPase component
MVLILSGRSSQAADSSDGDTSTYGDNPARLLEASSVVAGYREQEILHGVSIHIADGEMVAIIGPNGSGKSTLLKAIIGLVRVTAGTIRLMGEEITNAAPEDIVERGLAYCPQTDNVFPSLSVNENLRVGGFLRRSQLRERLDHVYSTFPDLAERRGRRAGHLSGGQRQMLAMARALMLDPKIMLLDEPSAGLSPKLVDDLFERIAEINRGGTAILLVEQSAQMALTFSSRAYVLAMGKNAIEADAKTLLQDPEIGKLYLGR